MNKVKHITTETYLAGLLVVLLVWTAGCSDNPASSPDPEPPAPSGEVPEVVDPDVIIDLKAEKISQLVGDYDNEREQPTQNRTYSRYQLRATDLGVPFQDEERTWILFGDTWGVAGGNQNSLAYTSDTDPEDGLSLDFVEGESGTYHPIMISGISQSAFEVPTDGVMVNGEMYIYHTTDSNPGVPAMGRSVIARSNDDGGKTFTYLYDFSIRKFINISIVKVPVEEWDFLPENEGEGLVIFGSGSYRKSNVYLAFQPAPDIEDPETIRYFAGVDDEKEPLWETSESEALPLFDLDNPCVGEFSVSYNTFIDRWILLYNCSDPRGINLRTAEFPWGPWTESQIVFHPWDDEGYCHFIHTNWDAQQCDSVHDAGREYEWGGEYGPYQFEHFATGDDQSTTIYFTMSTWNPYTVVLMKTGLKEKSKIKTTSK